MTDDEPVGGALRLANRTHRLAMECGDQSLGAALEWESRRWQERRTTVVVVGETKRGKTSLINALVRRPELLPVSPDVTTAAQVVVRHASSTYARVTRRREDETVGVEDVDLRQLTDYATALGDPALRTGVLGVEVGTDDDLLSPDLVLIDTPGFGSMLPGHREAAMTAAASADLLLMVLAADEPILRSELDFLLAVAHRVAAVVFVMTRTDLNPDWEGMRREHRDRIRRAAMEGRSVPDLGPDEARRAERLDAIAEAPMLAVSSRLELRALARGGVEGAAMSRRSGVDAVRELLHGLVARRDEVRARNVVRLVDSGTRRIEAAQLEIMAAAGEGSGPAGRDLDAELAALDREAEASARWRRAVRLGGQRLQTAAATEVARRVDALDARYREHLATLSAAELDRFAESVADDLERSTTALCVDLSLWLESAAAEEFAQLRDQLGDTSVGELSVGEEALRIIAGAGGPVSKEGGGQLFETGMPVVSQSWVWGSMAGALFGVAVGAWFVLPIGAAVAAPLAVVRQRKRNQLRSRQECGRVVRESLTAIRRELAAVVGTRIAELRAELEDRIDAALQTRRRELERERRILEAARSERDEERRRRVTTARQWVERAREIRSAAEDLRARLTDVVVAN